MLLTSKGHKMKNMHQGDMFSFGVTATKRSAPTQPRKRVAQAQPSIDGIMQNQKDGDVRVANNASLQMAIADWVHSDGHPFSAPESARFKKIL